MTSGFTNEALDALIDGIEQGIQAHLAWNQRLLRCALLREAPADEMAHLDAHRLCKFGIWFAHEFGRLEAIDAALVAQVDQAHAAMHAAVRAICERVLGGELASGADVATYETSQSTMVARLSELRARIGHVAMQLDPLTGLPLRHGIERMFERRASDARRGGDGLFLAMIDIDHFKAVNDTHGHPVGDLALRHVAQGLRDTLRESDMVIRFGGEEFLALIRTSDLSGAEVTAQRLLRAVRNAPLQLTDGTYLASTITVGLARVRLADTLADVIHRADRALLQGKLAGRDRLVVAEQDLALDEFPADCPVSQGASCPFAGAAAGECPQGSAAPSPPPDQT